MENNWVIIKWKIEFQLLAETIGPCNIKKIQQYSQLLYFKYSNTLILKMDQQKVFLVHNASQK